MGNCPGEGLDPRNGEAFGTLPKIRWVSSMQPHEATRFWNPQKECRAK